MAARINVEQARETALAELRKQVAYLDLLAASMHNLKQSADPFQYLENLHDCYAHRARRITGFLDEHLQ